MIKRKKSFAKSFWESAQIALLPSNISVAFFISLVPNGRMILPTSWRFPGGIYSG